MPGRDNTGPLGTGPIGRGLGPCGGGMAYGGRGRGFGRGRGWGFFPPALTPDEEKELLNQQKSWLQKQIDALTSRLRGLEEKEQK